MDQIPTFSVSDPFELFMKSDWSFLMLVRLDIRYSCIYIGMSFL